MVSIRGLEMFQAESNGNVGVYFLALDAEGRAVQRMRSFTHFSRARCRGVSAVMRTETT